MDLKFINSEYFFILSAIIKEMDDDDETEFGENILLTF